jgi:hypothetical protein
MRHIRTLPLFLLALPIFLAAAAPAASLRDESVPISVSGVYSVAFNVNLASALPAGTTLLCRAKVSPNASPFNGFSRNIFPSQAGVAAINGSMATCWVEIPLAWTQNDTSNGAALSYEIQAVSDSGSQPAVLRASTGQGIGVAYPAAGGSAQLNVNVTF